MLTKWTDSIPITKICAALMSTSSYNTLALCALATSTTSRRSGMKSCIDSKDLHNHLRDTAESKHSVQYMYCTDPMPFVICDQYTDLVFAWAWAVCASRQSGILSGQPVTTRESQHSDCLRSRCGWMGSSNHSKPLSLVQTQIGVLPLPACALRSQGPQAL